MKGPLFDAAYYRLGLTPGTVLLIQREDLQGHVAFELPSQT
jgi:hypothetical protein